MIDQVLTNFFLVFPYGFLNGIISFFVCWFVFITLLDIIEL